MFNLRCNGLGGYSPDPYSSIGQFGGPILYLVLQIIAAFSFLVYVDSGAPVPAFLQRGRIRPSDSTSASNKGDDVLHELSADVRAETQRMTGAGDMLKVLNLSKRYPGAPKDQLAVNDVTFGTQLGETFALIGPNGAGKSTVMKIIQGTVSHTPSSYIQLVGDDGRFRQEMKGRTDQQERPSAGDVLVSEASIIHHRNVARAQLGQCNQFDAIDAHLTGMCCTMTLCLSRLITSQQMPITYVPVKQHLWLYARLKGVPRNRVQHDIDVLLAAAGLAHKADHLATSLSGGNVRKLSLLMALIGDRPLVLIDEFSSGVDSFSKREAWKTVSVQHTTYSARPGLNEDDQEWLRIMRNADDVA